MVIRKRTCEFAACDNEFFSNGPHARYCSDECRRSHEILQWAPRLLELRAEGKSHREVGKDLGISKEAALTRAIRLPTYRDRYPMLNWLLEDKEEKK